MCVSVDFALIHQAFLVIVKKLDGILDGDHVLFTFAVDLVKHGSERGGLAGARRAGHKDESTGLVAQSLHDQRQSKSVEAFDFPRNRTKDRAYSTALIENFAAKASQVFQAKGKIQLQRRGANKNQFAQLIVNFHDLVEARAALVAALVTGSAAFAVVNLGSLGLFGSVPSVDQCLLRNLQLFLAVRTDAPHETLRANQVH